MNGMPSVTDDPTVRASWAGTAVFTIVAAVAAATTADAAEGAVIAVSLALFGAGCVAFLLAYGRAVRRSRTDAISVTNVYLLTGDAVPSRVKRHLLGSTGAQLVVALAAASVRPFSPLAFGILVPMYGLGLGGLWAARHGAFPPRSGPTSAVGRQ